MLNKAIEIASKVHSGKVDITGSPYIQHPLRLLLSGGNDFERICAVLHDVVEKSQITFDDLRREGFNDEVIKVLDCLTRREGECFNDFITRITANKTACHIKLADLRDDVEIMREGDTAYQENDIEKTFEFTENRLRNALQNF